jgi:glycopeptide antibiotics resistance protein
MIFFLFGLLFRTRSTRWVTAGALLFSFSIEISQLYHSQWIDLLRKTRIGGLVLGYGFLWSDLLSYTVGIGVGLLIERLIFLYIKRR